MQFIKGIALAAFDIQRASDGANVSEGAGSGNLRGAFHEGGGGREEGLESSSENGRCAWFGG